MRLASLSFELRSVQSVDDFFDHVDEVLEEAYCANADWMILPENFSYELLHLPEFHSLSEAELAGPLADLHPLLDAHFRSRTTSAGFSLVAGSHLARSETGIFNRGCVYCQSGEVFYADKQVLTQYEIQPLGLQPGVKWQQPLDFGLGVAVCYDSEFPEAGRALAESGATVIAVPAFTETEHGFHRVAAGARARALENQCIVAVSSLVGSLGREPVPSAVGVSAIYAPPIAPFPADGILATSQMNRAGMAIADLDLEALEKAREKGDVRNWHDRTKCAWTITN